MFLKAYLFPSHLDHMAISKQLSNFLKYYACPFIASAVWFSSAMLLMLAMNVYFYPIFQGLRFSNITSPHRLFSLEVQGFVQVNETARLLMQVTENGTRECHNIKTTEANFFGLPSPKNGSQITLSTDQVHEFYIVSYDNGSRRCNGGDFYETDLSGPTWKSRPPIEDRGDGSYAVKLFVDSRFEGLYTFSAVLLFSNFHGLERWPDAWVQKKSLIVIQIKFKSAVKKPQKESSLNLCGHTDFKDKKWNGRWNRIKGNETCSLDNRGRSICIPLEEKCEDLWCEGAVGLLESNGWVYSAHCKFHIWTKDEAWQCLNHKWLFFWGDSNHQDTVRNLLNFIFGDQYNISYLPRTCEFNVKDSNDTSRRLRINMLFNGHPTTNDQGWGLHTIMHPNHQAELRKYFTIEQAPDVVILNSGLHDGKHWLGFQPFIQAAEFASDYWHDLWMNTTKRPLMVYRSTVAPAGASRSMPSNPQKMEAYNTVLTEQFVKRFSNLRMVDAYDMTFPWHYDHCCSDGGHYGRPPLYRWFGRNGHMYFVDIMLVHVLLNSICPSP